MSVKDSLQSIYETAGVLTPELVVETAKDPEHELHERFEWDDTAAAASYRLVQAQFLIRSVTIQVQRQPDRPAVRVRAFVADREVHGQTTELVGNYRPVEEVVQSDTLRTAWFRSLERDWKRLRERAGASREFADMVLADMRVDVA